MIEPGAIIEIGTSEGLAYAQYVGLRNWSLTESLVVRVLPGFFMQRPADLQDLVSRREIFWETLDVGDPDIEVVGVEASPNGSRAMPRFRSFMGFDRDGRSMWRVYEGDVQTTTSALTQAERSLSDGSVGSVRNLRERLERGWRPET